MLWKEKAGGRCVCEDEFPEPRAGAVTQDGSQLSPARCFFFLFFFLAQPDTQSRRIITPAFARPHYRDFGSM